MHTQQWKPSTVPHAAHRMDIAVIHHKFLTRHAPRASWQSPLTQIHIIARSVLPKPTE